MRLSAIEGPAMQAGLSPTKALFVLVDVIPRNSANVKSELTLTIPSKAIM